MLGNLQPKPYISFICRIALITASLFIITSCGDDNNNNFGSNYNGGDYNANKVQVVAFGDSLTDAGTYALASGNQGGGPRFTTNPGEVWAQQLARNYENELFPATSEGFGITPTQNPYGFDFAEGGARVMADYVPPDPTKPDISAKPVGEQIDDFLSREKSFKPNQLVLINGGANDVLFHLEQLSSTPPKETFPEAQAGIEKAARDLNDLVKKLHGDGAKYIVIANLPDLKNTPLGFQLNQQNPVLVAIADAAVKDFNKVFLTALQPTLNVSGPTAASKILFIDTYQFFDDKFNAYQSFGFKISNTATACDQAKLTPYQGSSLFCSPDRYTNGDASAPETYMFADAIHPTTHLHRLFADFVQKKINAEWGKLI